MELRGTHGTAIVYADDIEPEAARQIIQLLDQSWAEGANVRIMPDCHSGKGCVIGYTARLGGRVVPNLIGVDIGCGVRAWNLGRRPLSERDFEELDAFVDALWLADGLAKNTLAAYRSDLALFAAWLNRPQAVFTPVKGMHRAKLALHRAPSCSLHTSEMVP